MVSTKYRKMSLKKHSRTSRRHPHATLHSLTKWYTEEFEKLGWMVLAKKHGYYDKIKCYKHSLYRLKDAIETRLKVIKEEDRAYDLKMMLNNVSILIDHANKDF